MQQEGPLAAVRNVRPAPRDEARPAPQQEGTLAVHLKMRPGPWDEATRDGMPVE